MLKDLARRLVPETLRTARYERQLARRFAAVVGEWREMRAGIGMTHTPGRLDHVLIFPGDPGELIGSLGDEAMITGTIQSVRAINPNVTLHILVDGAHAAAIAGRLGLIPIDIWSASDFLHRCADYLAAQPIDAVLAVGADVIDGVYGIVVPAGMICACDIAARMGVAATILGSSFNTAPRQELAPLFDEAHPAVAFLLRDAISLERFARFTSATPTLVADSAFALSPSDRDPQISQWVAQCRASARRIIGFNLHPMLVREVPCAVAKLVEAAVASLDAILTRGDTAVLLIPHDRRQTVGDAALLRAVYECLAPRFSASLRLLDVTDRRAGEIKAIAGLLDGVVTGRMHLAIAALGMGVPVLCVSYQDKFEGLLDHFGLPGEAFMTVAEAGDPLALTSRLEGFIGKMERLRAVVDAALPQVRASARRNFASLALGAEPDCLD